MNEKQLHVLGQKLDLIINSLEQLLAVQMKIGDATQLEISHNLGISIGKVNGLIRGVKPVKSHDN